ncbi:MAG: DUF47 family protein [Desulfurococcales archaeon]|nr:DUF47 family protein [Desulfurococcales archaeon]
MEEEYYDEAEMYNENNVVEESIAEMSIREQLSNIAINFSNMASTAGKMVETALNADHDPLAVEKLKKMYEREILGIKEKIDGGRERLFRYLSRMRETISYLSAYAQISILYTKAAQYIEGFTYRLFLYTSKYQKIDEDVRSNLMELISLLNETSSSLLRVFRSLGVNKTIVRDAISDVKIKEEEADSIYRTLYVKVIERYSENVKNLLLLESLVESLENSIDLLKDISDYSLILI